MRDPEKSYHCSVCRWQGRMEPVDAGDSAPCPQCGVFLYPLTWMQTWGIALALNSGAVAFVFIAVFLLTLR